MAKSLVGNKQSAVLAAGAVILGIGIAIVVLAADFVMLIFLGILFGVFLTKLSDLLNGALRIGRGWHLAFVVLALITATVAGLWLFGVQVQHRVLAASDQLDDSLGRLEKWLEKHPLAKEAIGKLPYADELVKGEITAPASTQTNQSEKNSLSTRQDPSAENDSEQAEPGGGDSDAQQSESSEDQLSAGMLQSAAGRVLTMLNRMMSTTFGLLANLGVIFFVGLFLAVDPALYRDGFARLFPVNHRARVAEIMNMMGDAMFRWLNGRFLAMAITGVGTAIALALLRVPMPITVGVATGLLNFVPNIGAILSLALALLMALSQGPVIAMWVVVLYAALQIVESNVITPLVQQHQTSIPPALLLSCQITMGALTGFLGMLIATPMLAATLVLVREAWVRDVLED